MTQAPELMRLQEDLAKANRRCALALTDLLSDNAYAVKRLFEKLGDTVTFEAADRALHEWRRASDALLDGITKE